MKEFDLDFDVSVFKNVQSTDVEESVPISVLLGEIADGKYKETIEILRKSDKKAANEIKTKKLPMVAMHGNFHNRREKADFNAPSGIIIVDIDDISGNIEDVKEQIVEEVDHILAAMVSPSGNGIKLLYLVDSNIINKDTYRQIGKIISKKFMKYGVTDILSVTDCLITTYDPNIIVDFYVEPDFSIKLPKAVKRSSEHKDLVLDEDREQYEDPEEFYKKVLLNSIQQKSDNNFHFIQMSVFDLARFGFKDPEYDLSFVVEYSEEYHKVSSDNFKRLKEACLEAKNLLQERYPYLISEEFETKGIRKKTSNKIVSDKIIHEENVETNIEEVVTEEEEWDGLEDYDDILSGVREVYDRGERAGMEVSFSNFADILRFKMGTLCTVIGIPSHGKALTMDSDIITPKGLVKMSDIKVGDNVLSIGGEAKVIGVYPQGKKDIYEVTFSDNSSVKCCKEHIWRVKNLQDRRKGREFRDIEMLKIMETYRKRDNGKRKEYNIPLDISYFDKQELILDPYLIGALIGDGSLGSSIKFHNPDMKIIKYIDSIVFNYGCTTVIRETESNCYEVLISKKHDRYKSCIKNEVLDGIRKLKLNVNVYNKFIPKQYIYNSVENRMNLLGGLLDTDGYVSKGGDLVYSTSSEKLRDDVIELVQSLGGTATFSSKFPQYVLREKRVVSEHKSFAITINLPTKLGNPLIVNDFRRNRFDELRKKREPTRFISDIKYVGKEDAQCIMVDNESHLFFTNSFVLTHNTEYVDSLIVDLFRMFNLGTLVVGWEQTKEEHLWKIGRKILGYFPKKGSDRAKKDEATKIIIQKIKHLNVNEIGNDINKLLKYAEIAILRHDLKVLVLDPFNHISTKHMGSDHAQVNDILKKIVSFTKRMNILTFLVVHPTKMQQDEKTNKFKVPNLYNAKGSSAFYEMTYDGFVVYRDDDEEDTPVMIQTLKVKQNNMGTAHKKAFFRYEKPSGRYIPVDPDGDNIEGDWDDKNWLEKYLEKFKK